MKFTKMHGIGNDYIYINGFHQAVVDPASLARTLADRHYGIGGDGLILILPSDKADARMRMFNADGSESEMCGNGVRCVAKYVFDHQLSKNNPLNIETGRGVLPIALHLKSGRVESATVDMGLPILDLPKIPADAAYLQPSGKEHLWRIGAAPASDVFDAALVSMGNPHAVIYTQDVAHIDLARIGPILERHLAFPRRINIHFFQVHDAGEITMRTWERGSGITLACGTGACAVCVAGVLTGHTRRKLLAHLPGGDLNLEWRENDNHVHMTGPATEVFSGEWPD